MKPKTNIGKLKVLTFLLPALLIYVLFLLVPIFGSFYFSLADWDGIQGSKLDFVGLEHYIDLVKDKEFLLSVKNMLMVIFFSLIFHIPIALLLAVTLNAKFKGRRFFKAVFFVPTIFPLTAIGLLWYFILMPDGSFNSFLDIIGLSNLATSWLADSSTAMGSIIFVNVWSGLGFYMVILLAGLTTIPQEIYDAAEVDGASSTKKFFHIIIPMLKPILTMCVLLDIVRSVKVFDLIFVMTEGGPNGITNVPTTLSYFEAFRYNNFGFGSAIGVVILIIAFVLTIGSELLMNRTGKEHKK